MKNLTLANIRRYWPHLLVVLALSLFLVSLIAYKLPLPAALDLPRQMANGRDILLGNWEVLTQNYYSYTQTNHYFANHHWLYGVIAYLLHVAVGWSGMTIFKILFISVTFLLLFKTALKKADFWLVALCSIPTIFMLSGRSDLRPELFGNFFIVLYIYLLLDYKKHIRTGLLYILIPLQIIWANLHITFPMGVLIVMGFWLERLLDTAPPFSFRQILARFSDPLLQKLSILLVALIVASFINPLGIGGVIYSLTANIGANGPVKSAEVQSLGSLIDDYPKWSSIPFALVQPLAIILMASFLLNYRRKPIFYFLGSVGASILALTVLRGGPFLGIFFLLAFTANLNAYFLRFKRYIITRSAVSPRLLQATLGIVFVLSLYIFTTVNFSKFSFGKDMGIGLESNSLDSARFFIDNKLRGPIFNDTDIGSYLSYFLYPGEKIYADNRFGDAYSDEFFSADYAEPIQYEEKWREVLNKYNFNVIFLYQYDQGYNMRDFMYRRIQDPEWALVYADRFSIILVRNTAENGEVIAKYHMNSPAEINKRLSYLTENYNGYNQIAAADILALMGYVDRAMANYAVAVAEHPDWAKIWFTMGKMELQRTDRSNPALALMYLHQAIERGWKTPNAYSFLALAYYRMGQLDLAEDAVHKQLKINPKSKDAQLWLGNIARAKLEAKR